MENLDHEIIKGPMAALHPQITELTTTQQFYERSNVLVTGFTGFLGQLLVEKLLRSCPVSKVYVLVGNKKGKEMNTRLENIFDDPVFQTLKQQVPKFRAKVVGVEGNCSLPSLGLSTQDETVLMEEVNIIFHLAATVRFDEKLKVAGAINVRATQDVMKLANQMPNLKALVHVSTAFTNCIINSVIEETIYPSPIDYKKLIMLTESLPDKILDNITPQLLGKYPNTYIYTKHIAEEVVKEEGHELPVGIMRPSIVVSTYKEPIKAWINNTYGVAGIAAGSYLGLVRSACINLECKANMVPADMCVNFMISAACDIAWNFEMAKKNKTEVEIPVYNYDSGIDMAITWKKFIVKSKRYALITPSRKAIWYCSFIFCKSYISYIVTSFLFHNIPALIVDGILLAMGKLPKMSKIYSKVHKALMVLSYFTTRDWSFRSENIKKVLSRMSDRDRQLFFSDLKKLDWEEFLQSYGKGIRVYLIQDPMDTLQKAKRKCTRLYWAHQITKTVVTLLVLKALWSLYSFIYSVA